MNLHDAIGLMIGGSKIKLPEWSGYWFIPENGEIDGNDARKSVRVLTKDGEILDEPWFDKYENRTDFEVTEGKMGFDFAIRALKNGKRVARIGWNGKGMYLIQFTGAEIAKAFGYGFGECVGEFTFSTVFAIKTAQNEMVLGWKPTQPDMLSEDWVLVQ